MSQNNLLIFLSVVYLPMDHAATSSSRFTADVIFVYLLYKICNLIHSLALSLAAKWWGYRWTQVSTLLRMPDWKCTNQLALLYFVGA